MDHRLIEAVVILPMSVVRACGALPLRVAGSSAGGSSSSGRR
jgi:hypothetical protein